MVGCLQHRIAFCSPDDVAQQAQVLPLTGVRLHSTNGQQSSKKEWLLACNSALLEQCTFDDGTQQA
jgi:hypothetical protein